MKRKHRPKTEPKLSHEQLGQMLTNIYESGYIDRNQAYKMSFLKGLLSGLGGVLGATVLVALLIWLLSLMHNVPFVNNVTDNLKDTVQTKPK